MTHTRRHELRWAAPVFALAVGWACGGGAAKETEAPAEPAPAAGGGGGDGALIPDEKYDEIRALFGHKTGTVSRCYVEGVESGQVDRNEKGHVTVGLTINPDGSPSEVRVMESSFRSQTVGECVVRLVSGWTFPTLPRALPTSHTYVLDRL